MCADFGHLAREVAALEAAGADGFHLDLMDGVFVPNFAMGLGDIAWVCAHAHVPCDVHMMVTDPSAYVSVVAELGARVVYVHPEAGGNTIHALGELRERGVHPGIAVNPTTPFAEVEPLLPLVDYVLAMTVNPGFAGQRWIDAVNPKLAELAAARERFGFDVVVDGNCSPERIEQAADLGVRGFVLGTAGLFGHGDYASTMASLRTRAAGRACEESAA